MELRGTPDRRVCEWASRDHGRCGAGHVRRCDDAHRRWRGRVFAAHEHGQKVGQRRHRARDRLRHRPVQLQGEGSRCLAAVGRRPRALSALRGSVAHGALHRSSERRVVHELPRSHPAAHGPRLSRRQAEDRQSENARRKRARRRSSRASTRSTRSRSSRARAPRASWASRTRDISAWAQTRTSRSTAATPTTRRCSRRRRYVLKAGTLVVEEGQLRRAPAGKRIFVQPGYDDMLLRDLGKYFEAYSSIQLANYPVTGLRDTPVPTGAR